MDAPEESGAFFFDSFCQLVYKMRISLSEKACATLTMDKMTAW
jgi:hypothetical protein